ncbi:DUF4062 domain-containing protein [Sporomusa termitida]|uniref:DUF4062 domain-containing protein n=1 Tax=Sporomusa termitida TaxID=2377 RepID=A0A517E033_9FIRM|nr:DUF4062 domain-containing protein [Sporomusa termitida]QDR82962.1 hypothetical protein SPTER_44130 [Sporomusa termitida]
MSEKKYQIFISSTYNDLVKAREKVIETVLSMYHFPIGMEMFSAADDDQWQVIKDTIDQSDYYVIIIGHRYGSETAEGISYTEKEYDYAKSKGIPILAFIRDRNVATKPDERDSEAEKIEKLNRFIIKAEANKMRDTWKNIDDLGGKVAVALTKTFGKKPGIGWVRADKAISPEMTNELTALSKENRDLREALDELKKQVGEKAPEIDVCFTKDDLTNVICKNLQLPLVEYPKPLNMDDVPSHLTKYVAQEDIDKYNNAEFPSQEEIDSYNQKITEYYIAKNNPTYFSIAISNHGKSKANEIFVDIILPQGVIVAEKEDVEDWEFPENIMPENPIEKGERKYKKEREKRLSGPSWLMLQQHSNITLPSYNLSNTSNKLLAMNINRDYSIDIQQNKVSIQLDTLMHTKTRTIGEFVLIPFQPGKFEVQVTIICEEYSEPQTYSLPITIVQNSNDDKQLEI